MNGAGETSCERSVADLFGDAIVLRDMNPRGGALAVTGSGGEAVRGAGWAPRKRDGGYAGALIALIERHRAARGIVYVGDSLLQDGAAIRGLRSAGPPGRVWGFLCDPTGSGSGQDLVEGTFVGSGWDSLGAFIELAGRDDLRLDRDTWVLFDLDHTVYAAKGGEERSLESTRSDAVSAYVESKVPAANFEISSVEWLYREYESDPYRELTQDNLDYVAALVLATSSGLTDVDAVRKEARSPAPEIASVLERVLGAASTRVDLRACFRALGALEEVRLGARAGNPTPCREVRRHECLATAARMRTGTPEADRICLNRPVIDLLDWVVAAGAQVLAVSDRPPEAAVAMREGEEVDLMTIPMSTRGRLLRFTPPAPA